MIFIELTMADNRAIKPVADVQSGRPVSVNVQHIAGFHAHSTFENTTCIQCIGDSGTILVTESYSTVRAKLRGAKQ